MCICNGTHFQCIYPKENKIVKCKISIESVIFLNLSFIWIIRFDGLCVDLWACNYGLVVGAVHLFLCVFFFSIIVDIEINVKLCRKHRIKNRPFENRFIQ